MPDNQTRSTLKEQKCKQSNKKQLFFWIASFLLGVGTILIHPAELNYIPWATGSLMLVSLFGMLFSVEKTTSQKIYKDSLEFRWALFIMVIVMQFVLCLLALKIFQDPDKFPNAKVEWFVVLFSSLSAVGAWWAIAAKMKADQAFEAATEASEAANGANEKAMAASKSALDAFQAIAGIVSFEDMLIPEGERQRVPMLRGLVDAAHQELIMVLGVPVVGYFRRITTKDAGGTEIYSYPLRTKSLEFCHYLATVLRRLNNNQMIKKVRLFYLDDLYLAQLLDNSQKRKEINDNDIQKFKDAVSDLASAVKQAQVDLGDKFICTRYSIELGLRYVISHSQAHEEMSEDKALVWVVSDFERDDPGGFSAAGFTTRDANIIENLRRLAEDYIKILPNLTSVNHNQDIETAASIPDAKPNGSDKGEGTKTQHTGEKPDDNKK